LKKKNKKSLPKPLDKPRGLWYNISTEKEMRYNKMKTFYIRLEHNGIIYHSFEKAFTFKGAFKKAKKKAEKNN
jgi:hypothetical protein